MGRVRRQRGRRIGAGRNLLEALEHRRPPLAERPAPGELRQHGGVQHVDVPGLGALAEQLRCGSRGGPCHPLLDPVPEVVEGGPRHRGEGGDPALGAGDRRELPALYGAPVVADQVHGPVRADRVRHRQEVVGQLLQGEAAAERLRRGGAPVAAYVVEDHVEARREPLGDLRPDLLAVRIAVHQHHRRPARLAELHDTQLDTAGAHPALARTRRLHRSCSVHAAHVAHAAFSSAQRRTCGRSSSSQNALSSGSRESVTTRISSNFAPVPLKPRCGSTAHRPGCGGWSEKW